MEYDNLTKNVLHFKKTGHGLSQIIEQIVERVYWFAPMRKCWSEDESCEFLLYFYPKINTLIKRFSFDGSSFEAYLRVTLKYQMQTYLKKKYSLEKKEKFANYQEVCDWQDESFGWVGEESGEISTEAKTLLGIDENGRIEKAKNKKRLLYLAFKGAAHISDQHLDKIVNLTGCDKAWFIDCLDQVRQTICHLEAKHKLLRAKTQEAFFKIHNLEEKIADSDENNEKLDLEKKLQKQRNYMRKLQENLRKASLAPSHRDIARITGLPKGSVDSGLYYIRKALESMGVAAPHQKTDRTRKNSQPESDKI